MDAERTPAVDEWERFDLPLTLEDRRAFLSSHLGRGLRPRDLATMMGDGYARVFDAPRGEILALAAQDQSEFLIVLAGRLEVARSRPDGGRQILDVIGPQGACGAVTALAARPRWPAEVHVIEDARLMAVSTRALLADAPPDVTRQRLLQNLTRLLANRARHLHARAELLSRRGLRERLCVHLLRQADAEGRVEPNLTRQELADHLGVSRASMTRELGRMADEGLVRIRGRGFQILDRAEVSRVAG